MAADIRQCELFDMAELARAPAAPPGGSGRRGVAGRAAPAPPRVPSRLRGRELLLGETSSLCAFAQVGHAHTLLDWFGDDLWVAREVYDELVRNRARFVASERLIRHIERHDRVVELSDEGVMWVARMAPFFRTRCDHGRKNVGELATARLAAEMIADGRRPIVLVDDRLGADLSRQCGAPVLASHEVVVEMVRAGALPRFEGARVWRGLRRNDADYERRLGDTRAG